jgi:hypothetical protein
MKKLEKPQGAYSKKNIEKLKLYLEKKNDPKQSEERVSKPTGKSQTD